MATATVPSFAPTASVEMTATQQSSNIALPTTGTPTIAIVQNLGEKWVYVALGTSNSVQVSPRAGIPIPPHGPAVPLTIGTNTYLAAVSLANVSAINITVGN
jgi:hypothetical protein